METTAGSVHVELVVTRIQLFNLTQEQRNFNINEKLQYLEHVLLSQDDHSENGQEQLKHKISYLKSKLGDDC